MGDFHTVAIGDGPRMKVSEAPIEVIRRLLHEGFNPVGIDPDMGKLRLEIELIIREKGL